MRFRLGFVSGFSAGYYLGAKAGRQRYEEIRQKLEKVRATEAYETAASKAKAIVDEGVDKAKAVVDEGVGKAKELVDRRSNEPAIPTGTNGTATVPTAAANPSAVPDGATAGSPITAPPADK
jgi:hypothetical protein